MSNTLRGKIKYNKLTGKLNVGKEYIKPTGTIDITSNGTFDVADYGKANVQLTVEDLEPKIITFVDYDGTLLYEIPLNELDEMPPLPEHDGLICQGWNWTLEQIKNENASFHVGPGYITDDGRTRIYVTLSDDDLDLWISFEQPSNGIAVYLDFGDGSDEYVSDAGGFVSIHHIYPHPGDYVISFYCEGTKYNGYKFTGSTGNPGVLLCRRKVSSKTEGSIRKTETLMPTITKVELGKYMYTLTGAFNYAINLKSITTPAGSATLGNGNTLDSTYSLKALVWNQTELNSYNLGQDVFTKSGLELLVTSPISNGFNYSTINSIQGFGSSLKTCYIPKSFTILPAMQETAVTINKLPSNLTHMSPTKLEDTFDYIPETVRSFSEYSLRGYKGKTYTFPKNIATHWSGIFSNNKFIEEIIYDDDTTVGAGFTYSNVCNKCVNLKRIKMVKSCNGKTSLGNSWFQSCYSLEDVTLPEDLITLPSSTFSNCRNLKQINIPETVTSFDNSCFDQCSQLSKINIPSGLTSIGNYVFQGCSSLKTIELPSTVTNIGTYAFSGCYGLTGPLDLSNLTSHSTYCFSSCDNLKSITLSKKATSIGASCFSGCKKLEYVYIPPNITTINSNAFGYNTGSMAVADYPNQTFDFRDHATIPTVQTNSFTKQTKLKIVVPDELYDTWVTTGNWTGYTSYIIKASDYTE